MSALHEDVPVGPCDYCGRHEPIVRSFPSEKTSRICAPCVGRVEMMAPERLLPRWSPGTASGLPPYERYLVQQAVEFMAEPALTVEPQRLPEAIVPGERREVCPREQEAGRNRFRSLSRAAAAQWMPIRVEHPRLLIDYGTDPVLDRSRYDGTHRVAAALAWGIAAVPVWTPTPTFAPRADPIYQTIALPTGLVHGQRPADRWSRLPRAQLEGVRLLDLACNSGRDGILACTLSRETSYVGYDADGDAVADGNAAAAAWGVADRATLSVRNLNQTIDGAWPAADVVCLFSASKPISFEAFEAAVRGSGARWVLFESHNLHDDPDSAKILGLPWRWQWLGNTVTVVGAAAVRRLWVGTVRP